MKNLTDELYEIKEAVGYEIGEANKRIKNAGGKISTADLDVIDKLTHSMKSLVTVCAMLEAEEEDGYSGDMMPGYGGNYSGRGRRNGYGGERRNGYSGKNGYNRNGGYSRTGDTREQLRQMMEEAPDEQTRMEIRNLMERMG